MNTTALTKDQKTLYRLSGRSSELNWINRATNDDKLSNSKSNGILVNKHNSQPNSQPRIKKTPYRKAKKLLLLRLSNKTTKKHQNMLH